MITRRYPPGLIAEEMRRGDVFAMVPYMLPILVASVSVLAYADVLVFRSCLAARAAGGDDRAAQIHRQLSWLRLLRARVAMAPLALIGYTAGVGGYGVWVARVTGAGVGYASGMVLYTLAGDLVAVSLVASLSIWVGGAEVSTGLRYAAPTVVLLLGGLQLVQPRFVSDEALPQLFRPWHHVPRRVALTQLAMRTANIYWISFWVFGGINAFGIAAPLSAITTYMPIILVVGSMPVNVAGFGAVQGAWLLLRPWADSGEQVLAFSLLWQLVFGAGLLLRGVGFIRAVAGEIDRGASRQLELPEATPH